MRLALAQINPTVGDLAGNAAKIADWIERARAEGADLVLFPELSLPGYPAEDLYLKRHFAAANQEAIGELASGVTGIVALVGFAEPSGDPQERAPDFSAPRLDAPGPRPVHNSLAALADGEVRSVYRKCRLPNYAVFDEARYFEPGTDPATIEVAGTLVGLTICEDVWVPGPPESLEIEAGAELIVNPSGSPYARGKGGERESMLVERARSYGAAFAFCNLVGGQDELVFDGRSALIDRSGRIQARARQFEEELLICELPGPAGPIAEPLTDTAEVYEALKLGLRDYVTKNGF
jgi:NAD+ synthase (glutamine-hydrolysing)